MSDRLTRVLSLALRHKPGLFGLTIDHDGWTDIVSLVQGILAQPSAPAVSVELVRESVVRQLIERFQIQGDRIRALYGHSLRHVSVGEPDTPPSLLFHATKAELLPQIRASGLLAGTRNGVHLTARWEYALSLRDAHSRKGLRGVVLAVRTEETRFKGIMFRKATEHIWLSSYIPPRFLNIVPLHPNRSPSQAPRTLIPLDNEHNRATLHQRIADELSGNDDSA